MRLTNVVHVFVASKITVLRARSSCVAYSSVIIVRLLDKSSKRAIPAEQNYLGRGRLGSAFILAVQTRSNGAF